MQVTLEVENKFFSALMAVGIHEILDSTFCSEEKAEMITTVFLNLTKPSSKADHCYWEQKHTEK